MFSDLVGSTALSARMDPEDLREVISAYQKCVAETVRRFGGFVAKYMGEVSWCIWAIRKRMRMTPSGLCAGAQIACSAPSDMRISIGHCRLAGVLTGRRAPSQRNKPNAK
jgi:class 3 adenylate cyclase